MFPFELNSHGFFRLITSPFRNESEQIVQVETPRGTIGFACPSQTTRWRAETALTKEPETIEWIDSFDNGDLLWDIGANVGIYSLYAALCGGRVSSFEPSPGNFFTLTRNIESNGYDNIIDAYCVAFNDETKIDSFHQVNSEIGSALHQFGGDTDWQGNALNKEATTRVAMIGYSIDDFVRTFDCEIPAHLKIDVDGIEQRIIAGATETLRNSKLKSLLIELDAGDAKESSQTIAAIEASGLKLKKKSREPGTVAGAFGDVINHIFER